jgi:3'-phosphoadenosine 5'-phosphosulfate (PAPS) 3'-phosphatase
VQVPNCSFWESLRFCTSSTDEKSQGDHLNLGVSVQAEQTVDLVCSCSNPFLSHCLQSWDHAVGVICVQEAGGQVTDWRGEPLDLEADLTGRRDIYPHGGILITNGVLHNKLAELIKANY